MATYKKKGYKPSNKEEQQKQVEDESTTAEVFNTLDEGAGRTETWVAENQKYIYIIVGVVGLSKTFYALVNGRYGDFRTLFKVIHVMVLVIAIIAFPILAFHESRFPEILERYSRSSFVVLSLNVVILAGLLLSFWGKKRSSDVRQSNNIATGHFLWPIKTYNYVSVTLVLCFLLVWVPLAYIMVLNNL